MAYNKQLVHSFYKSTFDSDVHLGFASVNITVLGLTNPHVYHKRMHQLYIVTHQHTKTERFRIVVSDRILFFAYTCLCKTL